MTGTFCWADLGTSDACAARQFYAGVFGWHCEDLRPDGGVGYTVFRLGGHRVAALYQQDSPPASQPGSPHWLPYISVQNADRLAERAKALGGTVLVEPLDVFEVGRLAIIRDPEGAVLALWEPGAHPGAGAMGAPSTIAWNELLTPDPERAAAFYGGLLGWTAARERLGDSAYTYFRDGDRARGGMLEIAPEWGPVAPHWLVYFAVGDCERAVTEAVAMGGDVLVPPRDVDGAGRYAVLQDPQGATFAVIQPK